MDAHEQQPAGDHSRPPAEGAGPPTPPGAPAGAPPGLPPSPPPDPAAGPSIVAQWEAVVPVWRSAVVIRQLFTVLAIGVLLVWLFMIILQAVERDLDASSFWAISRVFLIILAVLLGLAALTLVLLFRRYEYSFALDAQGIVATTTGATAKRNRVINLLLVLSGRPTAMGTGMLAASRQQERVRWRDVDTLKVDTRQRQIRLIRRRRTVMLIQCTEQNLGSVAAFIEARVPRKV